MRDLKDWTVEDVRGDTMTVSKCVSSDTGQSITFVVLGARIEDDYDEDGFCGVLGVFASFTIAGREPTDEEADEYSDDLRSLVREVFTA